MKSSHINTLIFWNCILAYYLWKEISNITDVYNKLAFKTSSSSMCELLTSPENYNDNVNTDPTAKHPLYFSRSSVFGLFF